MVDPAGTLEMLTLVEVTPFGENAEMTLGEGRDSLSVSLRSILEPDM